MTYYNENDPKVVAWLEELCARRLVSPGVVDARDIREVGADDVLSHSRCHFFAGIGGWDYALAIAGWPDDRPVWTGSCPCQPFSSAGKRQGEADERHLWPEFRRLIAECRPPTIFGEQVASRGGREWLARVRADLEALGYAVGAADLCAAGEAAPHIRQRLFWVADAGRSGDECRSGPGSAHSETCRAEAEAQQRQRSRSDSRRCSGDGVERLSDASSIGSCRGSENEARQQSAVSRSNASTRVDGMGNADDTGSQGRSLRHLPIGAGRKLAVGSASPWSRFDLIQFRDGKVRRIEPGTFPLAHGVPARVVRLRGYGNAIVPQVAATFIEAFLKC